MFGKVLKISSNDLYGNVDDRLVRVYACFKHIKYANNYVIFSFDGEFDKLYFGSIHLKDKSVVIFSIKDDEKKYILKFIDEYVSSSLKNFEIIKIDSIEKVELVSYNNMEYANLMLLEEKSIPKIKVDNVIEKERKPIFLYLIVMVLVLIAIGLTVLYFKPELFVIKYKGLDCVNKLYDEKLELYYDIEKNMIFDTDERLESISVIKTYNFLESIEYYEFKENVSNNNNQYFTNGEGIKFLDNELKVRLFYNESSIIDDYDEMLSYMKREGYSCEEREYER